MKRTQKSVQAHGKIAFQEVKSVNNTNTQQVKANNPRVTNTNDNADSTNSNFPLYTRELMMNELTDNSYSKKVNEVTKSRIIVNINTINEVFTRNLVDLIQYTETDSIESLAKKAMQGYSKICHSGFKSLYFEIVAIKNKEYLIPRADIGYEAFSNGSLCWIILQRVFQTEKKVFPEFKFTQEVDGIIIKDLDFIINESIRDIKEKINKIYSIFRILLDPSITIESKWNKFANFNPAMSAIRQNLELSNQSTDISKYYNNMFEVFKITTDCLSEEIFRLQHLTECLNALQHAPKTISNLRIAHNILKTCYDNEYKSLMEKKNESETFAKNRFKIKMLLRNLAITIAKPIDEATNKANALAENNKSTLYANSSLLQIKSSQQLIEIVEAKKVEQQDEIITSPKTNVETIAAPVLQEDLNENNLDDIEFETNAMMVLLRQIFEKDRAAKLKLKEAKLNKPKILIEETDDNIITVISNIQPTSPIQILNSTHQETLKDLFQLPRPGNLTISGKKVKHLIIELGGKSAGSKGSFTIHWNGSKKHGGDYEIHHDGGDEGFLTWGYAMRVAKAIHTAVKNNWVAKEHFTQDLLTIIENYPIEKDI